MKLVELRRKKLRTRSGLRRKFKKVYFKNFYRVPNGNLHGRKGLGIRIELRGKQSWMHTGGKYVTERCCGKGSISEFIFLRIDSQ
jgi:hypothetical protein